MSQQLVAIEIDTNAAWATGIRCYDDTRRTVPHVFTDTSAVLTIKDLAGNTVVMIVAEVPEGDNIIRLALPLSATSDMEVAEYIADLLVKEGANDPVNYGWCKVTAKAGVGTWPV
jgi:hypothetical protein